MGIINFENKGKYKKWLAYGHIHGVFTGPGQKIKIAGKPHKVKHTKKRGKGK
jgi:hypothetical protein